MGRISTKSWIEGRQPELVQVRKVRPTTPLVGDVLKIKDSPILLIKGTDDYYYIVDGNHRFFRKLFLLHRSVPAWILKDGDQENLSGEFLPQFVREWKEGHIDLKRLSMMAMSEYELIKDKINALPWFSTGSKEDEFIQTVNGRELSTIPTLIKQHLGINSYEEFWRIIEESETYIKTTFDMSKEEYITSIGHLIKNIELYKRDYDELNARMSGSGYFPPMGGCQGSFVAGLIKDRYNEAVRIFVNSTEPVIIK